MWEGLLLFEDVAPAQEGGVPEHQGRGERIRVSFFLASSVFELVEGKKIVLALNVTLQMLQKL